MMKPNQREAHEDPIVLEARQAGDEIAREAGYDLHELCERLRAAERQHPQRLAEMHLLTPMRK